MSVRLSGALVSACLCALFLLAACAKTEAPLPVILDLTDGTVRTEMEELVPLARHKQPGVTQLLLAPMAEQTDGDAAAGPLTLTGRSRAVAVGTYSGGFEPQAVYAPEGAAGRFMANSTASLNGIGVRLFPAAQSADDLAAQLTRDHDGQRVVLIGEPAYLEEVAEALAGSDVLDWPAAGRDALVHLAVGGGAEAAVQPFRYNVSRD